MPGPNAATSALPESPFVSCKVRMPISILPCHITTPKLGIDQELTEMLMRYSEKVEGVILAFSHVALEQPFGHIMNDQPFIHCKVLAEALVFQPREGMVLSGHVNKIGSNHIGMLVAGVFNASVAASEIPTGYVHNLAEDSWIGADGHAIAVGDTVDVKVLRVHVAGGVIAIQASMKAMKPTKKMQRKAKHMTPVTIEEPVSTPVQSKPKKHRRESTELESAKSTEKKRSKKSERKAVDKEPEVEVVHKKKSKKRKTE